MLPRSERIRTRDFSVAFSEGRILRHPFLVLRIYRRRRDSTASGGPQNRDDAVGAAFIVGKKQGGAATRNRVRRRVREMYRLHALRGDERLRGCDLIFAVTAAGVEATPAAVHEALDSLLSRAAGWTTQNGRQKPKIRDVEQRATPQPGAEHAVPQVSEPKASRRSE
jgi:ribonuclease P protein component